MFERGYDVSLLFGISDFYPKFGFVSCLPSYKLTLTTRIVERALSQAGAGKTAKVRFGRPEDFRRVRSLYNQEYACRTGSIFRTGRWKGFRMGSTWGSKTVTLVATGARDRILAYAGVDDREDALTVFEVAGDPGAYPALLRALAREAVAKRVESMAFLLPPDDRFSMYARRFGGSLTVNYPYTGGGMLRVINLATLFAKLASELTARLQAVGFSGPRQSFLLRTDVGSVRVTAGPAGVRVGSRRRGKQVVEMPQHRLSQLLFGFRTVADVAGEPGVRVPQALRGLLEVLFPLQWAHVSRADYF
jgi:hypothetical protein